MRRNSTTNKDDVNEGHSAAVRLELFTCGNYAEAEKRSGVYLVNRLK